MVNVSTRRRFTDAIGIDCLRHDYRALWHHRLRVAVLVEIVDLEAQSLIVGVDVLLVVNNLVGRIVNGHLGLAYSVVVVASNAVCKMRYSQRIVGSAGQGRLALAMSANLGSRHVGHLGGANLINFVLARHPDAL